MTQSFNIKNTQDKKILLGYLVDDAKNRLESWSEDQFREAFIDSKRKFLNFSFLETKNISKTEVEITYELTYLDFGNSGKQKGLKVQDASVNETKITHKKLCQMHFISGQWFISNVRSIKELMEYKDALALP